MTLTEKEIQMLYNIAQNDYRDGKDLTAAVWADCLDSGPFDLPTRSHGGLIASLTVKGLVWTNGESLGLTARGISQFNQTNAL